MYATNFYNWPSSWEKHFMAVTARYPGTHRRNRCRLKKMNLIPQLRQKVPQGSWNEFRFQDKTDREIIVRAPVGTQLNPLHFLLDDDGLPTTDLVYYDPSNPGQVVFRESSAPGLYRV